MPILTASFHSRLIRRRHSPPLPVEALREVTADLGVALGCCLASGDDFFFFAVVDFVAWFVVICTCCTLRRRDTLTATEGPPVADSLPPVI